MKILVLIANADLKIIPQKVWLLHNLRLLYGEDRQTFYLKETTLGQQEKLHPIKLSCHIQIRHLWKINFLIPLYRCWLAHKRWMLRAMKRRCCCNGVEHSLPVSRTCRFESDLGYTSDSHDSSLWGFSNLMETALEMSLQSFFNIFDARR